MRDLLPFVLRGVGSGAAFSIHKEGWYQVFNVCGPCECEGIWNDESRAYGGSVKIRG